MQEGATVQEKLFPPARVRQLGPTLFRQPKGPACYTGKSFSQSPHPPARTLAHSASAHRFRYDFVFPNVVLVRE